MMSIDRCVVDIKTYLPMAQQMGRRYLPKDLDPDYFDVVGQALIQTIEQTTKSMNDETKKVWNKVYRKVVDELRTSIKNKE